MRSIWVLFLFAVGAQAQGRSCAEMAKVEVAGVTFTKAATNAQPVAHCRVDGVIDRRTGVDGKEYGIGFALALPDQWNGRFLFQGGGGLNGNVAPPLGAQA